MYDEDVYRPTLSCPLRRQTMLVIDRGPELRPASLSPMMRSTTIDVDIKVHLVKAWGTMP